MTPRRVLQCVIFSLFHLVYGNVPVLLWESRKSDQLNPCPAIQRTTEEDFLQYLLKKQHGEKPLIAVFAEERLSMEDFSWQDSQGQGYFSNVEYVCKTADNTEFLPSVQNPIEATSQLPKYGYSMITSNANNIDDLPDGCGKVVIIKLPEARPEEDRAELLRLHDVKVAECYSKLLSKCSHVIGIMSGQQPSWVESEEVTRLRRSTDDNTTSVTGPYTLYQDTRGNSMLYSSKDPKLSIDSGKEISLQNMSMVVSGDNSKPNSIKLFVKYNNEYRLSFNFDNITNGYWYLRSVDLTNIAKNENYVLKSTLDIYAPLGMSYHCGTKVVFRNVSKDNTKELIFEDLQVEPFFFKAGSKSFSDAVDEVPFFTPAIWSGIFVTFLLALIFTWGISMIMDIRTMDQFDDPKGKTITVSATD